MAARRRCCGSGGAAGQGGGDGAPKALADKMEIDALELKDSPVRTVDEKGAEVWIFAIEFIVKLHAAGLNKGWGRVTYF